MSYLEIILPIILMALAFIMKLSINREIEAPNLIQAICELPVDMIFLTISFLGGFTILKADNPSEGLLYTISFIVVAAFILIIWRKSLKLFESDIKRLISSKTIQSFFPTNILLNDKKTDSETKIQ